MEDALLPENKDWSEKYKALDGILIERNFPVTMESSEPVRSDLVKILNLSQNEFDNWFNPRYIATEKLFEQYKLFESIPNLYYHSESQKYTMGAFTHVKTHLETLSTGLEYLDIIKQAYLIANKKE